MDDAPNRAEPQGALPLGELEAAVGSEAEAEARARLEPSSESREKAAALAKDVAPGADPLFDDPSAASGALPAPKPGSAPESERAEHVRDIVPVRAHQKTIEIRRVKVQGDESRRAPTQKLIRKPAADTDAAALAIGPEEAAVLQGSDGEAPALQAGDVEQAAPQLDRADASGARLRLAVWLALVASVVAVVLFVLWSGPPPLGRGSSSASPGGGGSERAGQGGAAAPIPTPSVSANSGPGANAAGASSAEASSATSSSSAPEATGTSSGAASSTASKRAPTATTTSGGPTAPSSAPTPKAATTSSSGLFFEKGSSDLNKP